MLSSSSIGKVLLETFLNSCSGVASGLERCAIFGVELLLNLARIDVENSSSGCLARKAAIPKFHVTNSRL